MPKTMRRPTSVTIIAALVLLSGVVEIAAGVWLLVAAGRSDPFANTAIEDWSDGQLAGGAAGFFVLGALHLLVAYGVLRGNRLARLVVTVLSSLAILGGVFSWPVGVGTVLVNVVILVMLWHRTADDYFKAD